jgi:Spy/CpxP family protein refolding chaperone
MTSKFVSLNIKGDKQMTEEKNVPNNTESVQIKKSSKKRTLLISLLIIIAAFMTIGGITFAQKMKQMRDEGPLFMMMERMSKDLNLTEQQKADMDKIRDEIKTKMDSKRENRKGNMKDFEDAFKQDKLDKETVKQLMSKHDADREEMKDFFIDEFIKFHDILTPDQRQKAFDKMHEMREKRGKHFDDDDKLPPNN